MRVPFLIHGAILSVNTCQLTDFLFPTAYEKIMAMGFRVNSPININSPWSSWNIRRIPVSLQRPAPLRRRSYAQQNGLGVAGGGGKKTKMVPLKNIFHSCE